MVNKLIFLDAVGTLFGVKGSVGHAYAEIARRHGVICDPQAVDRAFYRVFDGSQPLAFPDLPVAALLGAEYAWWQEIAHKTFAKTGDLEKFADFADFFAELYRYFAGAEPWFIYPDTIAALAGWRSQGIELGIISNFDSRLDAVLRELDLAQYFSSVTISSEAGSAKPDRKIFEYACAKHPTAKHFVHIGDSYTADVLGATKSGLSGLRGIWLNRQPHSSETRPHLTALTALTPDQISL